MRIKRSWESIGSAHYVLCCKLADASSQNIAKAASALPAKRLPHMTRDDRDAFLKPALLAQASGEPFSFRATFLFSCSIFVAASRADPLGRLAADACSDAATDLQLMMLTALEDGDTTFVLEASKNLDRFSAMLGQAYFEVLARGFQTAALMRNSDKAASGLAKLNEVLDIEKIQEEGRKLLPLAQSQCKGDTHRMSMLDKMQRVLDSPP